MCQPQQVWKLAWLCGTFVSFSKKDSAKLYISQQIVQSSTKKVKTTDKLFFDTEILEWEDKSAAVHTVKERVAECLKFVFHKIGENRTMVTSVWLCVHIQLFIVTWVEISLQKVLANGQIVEAKCKAVFL